MESKVPEDERRSVPAAEESAEINLPVYPECREDGRWQRRLAEWLTTVTVMHYCTQHITHLS